MKTCLLIILLLTPLTVSAKLYVTIIQGLGGNQEYSKRFDQETKDVVQALTRVAGKERVTALTGKQATREQILAHFRKLQQKVTHNDRAALILIGHGTYDGRQYKFNIPGPDLTGTDISAILKGTPARLQLLVNTSSASGALLKDLKSDSRIIITATRNGIERNATRFGIYFAAALGQHSADTDKNEAVSAAEAFSYAKQLTQDYYKNEGRLATEHPKLEGKHADQFTLARLMPAPKASDNPAMERLLKQRQQLDQQIDDLKLRRDEFKTSKEYYDQLQVLLLKMSQLQEQIDKLNKGLEKNSDADQP